MRYLKCETQRRCSRGIILSNKDGLKSILGTGFSRGYVLGSELILLLITTTWMAPNERGIYIAGYALLKTVTIVSSLSFGQIAIHEISERRNNSVGDIGGSLLIGSFLFSIIALLGLYAYGYISNDFQRIYVDPYMPLLSVGLPIFVLEIYFYAFLTALGRLNAANKVIVVGKTLVWGGVLTLGIEKNHLSSTEVLAALVGGQLVIVFGYMADLISEFARRGIKLSIKWQNFWGMVKKSIQLHPSIIGSVVFGGIDVLIVYKLIGPKPASEYQIAVQLIAALSVLPFAIAQFGYKLVSQLGARDAWVRFQAIIFKSLVLHCVLAVLAVWVVWFFAHNFFNGEYINVGELYLLMVFGIPGLFLSLVMAPFWVGFGYFSATSTLTIMTGALMLPLGYLLTAHYNVMGAAVNFVIAQILSVVVNGIFIRKLKRIHYA